MIIHLLSHIIIYILFRAKPKAPSTQKPSNVNNERRKRSQSHPSKVNIKKDIVEAESVLQMELEDDFMTNELKYVKEYKKSEIAPTSQSMGIDPLDKTHPLTLPFLNPKANLDDKLSLKSGELFFVQLPSSLPIKLKKEEMEIIENPEEDKKDSKENGNLLSTFPSSKIGKLQIYKSGKMKLIIGDVSFHVATGMPCNFLQEVVAISEKSGKYYQIGEITKRMVCYPDIVNSESNKS